MPVTSPWYSQTYTGNSVTVNFNYLQQILFSTDLKVTTVISGVSSILVNGVDYVVNGVGSSNPANWYVTTTGLLGTNAPLPAGGTITVALNIPLVTTTSLTTTNGTFEAVQGAFDRDDLKMLSLYNNIIQTQTAVAAGGVLSVNGGTGAVTITAASIGAISAASPALMGTPTAPTAAPGTNTTQIATTAFVVAAAYAPLASPTFTGVPAAPTASVGTNTTQVATTAFALAQFAAPPALGSTTPAVATVTTIKYSSQYGISNTVRNNASGSTYTISAADILNNGLFLQTSGSSTWTLPSGSAMDTAVGAGVATGNLITFTVSNGGSGTITISAATGFTLGASSYTIGANVGATFQAYRTNTANTWNLFKVSA